MDLQVATSGAKPTDKVRMSSGKQLAVILQIMGLIGLLISNVIVSKGTEPPGKEWILVVALSGLLLLSGMLLLTWGIERHGYRPKGG